MNQDCIIRRKLVMKHYYSHYIGTVGTFITRDFQSKIVTCVITPYDIIVFYFENDVLNNQLLLIDHEEKQQKAQAQYELQPDNSYSIQDLKYQIAVCGKAKYLFFWIMGGVLFRLNIKTHEENIYCLKSKQFKLNYLFCQKNSDQLLLSWFDGDNEQLQFEIRNTETLELLQSIITYKELRLLESSNTVDILLFDYDFSYLTRVYRIRNCILKSIFSFQKCQKAGVFKNILSCKIEEENNFTFKTYFILSNLRLLRKFSLQRKYNVRNKLIEENGQLLLIQEHQKFHTFVIYEWWSGKFYSPNNVLDLITNKRIIKQANENIYWLKYFLIEDQDKDISSDSSSLSNEQSQIEEPNQRQEI